MKRTGTALAAILMIASGLVSASAATLRVGIQDDPDALDPALSGTYSGRFVFAALCDKLVDISPDLKIVPQLAEAWEWSADGKSITFMLRKNVTFHDGTAFDAAAVKFNIERMKTMPDSKRKAELAPVASVEALAADKVKFNLSEPFVPLLANLSDRAGMMVSPKAATEKAGEFAAAPVCAGPYQFAERKSRDLIRVKKYPGYWDAARVGYDEVVYYYVPDSTVRLSRVRAGDLDLAERIAPTDLKTVRDDPNLALHSGQGLAVSHLMFNVGAGAKADTPLGKNSTLRQAFELAIDRNVINRVAFNGEFLADNQMIPPSSPFYDSARKAPARDVAKAKAMIAAAGMTRVPVEIQYENTAGDSRVAQIIQSMAGEAGFDVKLLPMETTTAIERYMNGNFEAYIGNWSGRADPDPTLVAFFSCAGSQNVNKYCNKDLDAILNQARGEADEAKRKALYAKATDIYLTALSSIPLHHPNWFFAARKSVGGIVMVPDGLLRLVGVKPVN
ncbi:peptide/nickel transport system substrate-binding protein [Bradyrhizobium japonicum]|uniref:Peptide/nickel transport system substrate-binding protein n=1 Tax=Bradyrhizobium japonicum TaxID=375 RepID=A0ABV2RSR8_BRAJP|nr:ABC transporter substrate-binding protein [Bradyrhizobium japonicum]MBR0914185.1 ABC transporter substrate-binding protein [Bradyrhizobium japonicum]UQD97067.1 ABC transporter substrate-binding protein [Bradyrhizobium japonicum]WLB17165.1 ABC transporter substrate-binding protein [Bradyrhizobium japonicum]